MSIHERTKTIDRRALFRTFFAAAGMSIIPPRVFETFAASPKSVDHLAQIKDRRHGLVELVREYTRLQKPLWRQVPALALEADGRSGYSPAYALAYEEKLWELPDVYGDGRHGSTGIDLRNGELVHIADRHVARRKSASDETVLTYVFALEELDARELVGSLTEQATTRHGYFADSTHEWRDFYDPQAQEAWRAQVRRSYRLPKLHLPVAKTPIYR